MGIDTFHGMGLDTLKRGPDGTLQEEVDVYDTNGCRLRANVQRGDALKELPTGIYIIGDKKVLIR